MKKKFLIFLIVLQILTSCEKKVLALDNYVENSEETVKDDIYEIYEAKYLLDGSKKVDIEYNIDTIQPNSLNGSYSFIWKDYDNGRKKDFRELLSADIIYNNKNYYQIQSSSYYLCNKYEYSPYRFYEYITEDLFFAYIIDVNDEKYLVQYSNKENSLKKLILMDLIEDEIHMKLKEDGFESIGKAVLQPVQSSNSICGFIVSKKRNEYRYTIFKANTVENNLINIEIIHSEKRPIIDYNSKYIIIPQTNWGYDITFKIFSLKDFEWKDELNIEASDFGLYYLYEYDVKWIDRNLYLSFVGYNDEVDLYQIEMFHVLHTGNQYLKKNESSSLILEYDIDQNNFSNISKKELNIVEDPFTPFDIRDYFDDEFLSNYTYELPEKGIKGFFVFHYLVDLEHINQIYKNYIYNDNLEVNVFNNVLREELFFELSKKSKLRIDTTTLSIDYKNNKLGRQIRFIQKNESENKLIVYLHNDQSIIFIQNGYTNENGLNKQYARAKEIQIKYKTNPDIIHKALLYDIDTLQNVPLVVEDANEIEIEVLDVYPGEENEEWVINYIGAL